MVCLKSHCLEKVLNVFAVNSGPLSEMTTLGIPYLEKGCFSCITTLEESLSGNWLISKKFFLGEKYPLLLLPIKCLVCRVVYWVLVFVCFYVLNIFQSIHYVRDVIINSRPVNDFLRTTDGFDYSKVTGMK